jgi:RHS repeat-associated protein
MPEFIDESELYLSGFNGSGEVQIDRGDAVEMRDGILKQVDGNKRFLEFFKGLTDKSERDAEELRRRRGQPPPTKVLIPPVTAVVTPPPQEAKPPTEDTPASQGAPELDSSPNDVVSIGTEPRTPPPLVNSREPSPAVYDVLNPVAPEDVVDLLAAPPADFGDFVTRLKRNENEPGERHPTHAAPAARQPAADADPVDLFSGAFTIRAVDLTVPTPFIPIAMARSYRSGLPYYGPFGYGWDHVYNVYLRPLNDGGVALWTGQLREEYFRATAGGLETPPGFAGRLERAPGIADAFTADLPGGDQWLFERPVGWSDVQRIPLVTVRDRHDNALRLSYGAADRLVSVLDDAGRGLLFLYGSCNLLERVTDHTGLREVRYEHDPEIEHLVRVVLPATGQYPNGLPTTYEYAGDNSHPAMRHNIVRILDAECRLMVENDYAGPEAGWEFNAVVRQRVAGFEYQFGYEQIQYVEPDPSNVEVLAARTLVRPPDGSLHTYTFNYRGDLLDHRFRLNRDGSFRVVSRQWLHDTEGNMTEAVGADGVRTVLTYDSANPDPCARRNLQKVELATPLPGSVVSRIVYKATYDPQYQLPVRIEDEIGAETRYFYDFDVSPAGSTGRLARIELPAVVGADGAPQQSVQTFEHNKRGQLTATIQAEGGRTELAYFSGGTHDGFLSVITADPAGVRLVWTLDYDPAGFPKQVRSPGGRATDLAHNALGQVEEVRAPEIDGQTGRTRRWFDDSGSVVRVERPAGSFAAQLLQGTSIVDTIERDVTGSVRQITLAGNTKSTTKLLQCVDHEGRAVSIWDPLGNRIDRVYAENGTLLSETDAVGESEAEETSYGYDRAGRVTRITGPRQDVTSIKYDVWGRASHIRLPSGAVRALEYGANDRLLEERVEEIVPGSPIPRVLQRRTYEYDRRGRRISSSLSSFRDETAPVVLLKTQYYYDRDDNVRTVVLPRGARFRYDFDTLGRLTGLTDPHGNVQRFTYDTFGDLKEFTLVKVENGVTRTTTRTNTYDARGRLQQSDCLGQVALIRYDDRDLPVEQRSPSGVNTRVQIDALGQLIESVIDPAGLALRTQFDYDQNGRLERFIDPTGQSTTWRHDALGRAKEVKPPDGTTWEYLTDTNAGTTEQRMPSGNRVVLAYVKEQSGPVRMVCTSAPGQEAVPPHDIAYDVMGRLASTSIGSDSVERKYDSLSRLTEETARGRTVSIVYDDAAGTEELVFPDGRRERTEYAPSGQPTRVVLVTPGDLGGSPGDVLLEIIYSTAGRPSHVRYGNGVEGQLVHDELGRVIRIEYTKGGVLLDSCRLRYDEGGHRAVVQQLGAPAWNIVYRLDGHERLVEAHSGVPLAPLTDVSSPMAQAADVAAARVVAATAAGVAFTLDDADVRTKLTGLNGGPADQSYTSSNDHRLTMVGASLVSYNPDGTRTGDGRYTYDLDALNRVRRVRDRVTNAVVAELQYDALARVAAGATNGQSFERWFAGSTRIHEISGPGAGAARQQSPHPLWPVTFSDIDASGPAYIHQDEGWSTVCITNGAGEVLERHRYDLFGASSVFGADGVTPLASPRTEPVWRGMTALGNTTLFRTPLRLYDPEVGVFTSRDPLLYFDSPSPYAFAAHNPVDFADPTGAAKAPLGIAKKIPFQPTVSDPKALAAAEGMGRIEWGDVKQLFKGAYNGLVNVLPLLLGPIAGAAASQLDIPKAEIDPRYGGAGIVGEQLAENLAFEATAAVPAIAGVLAKVFSRERLAAAVLQPVFLALSSGGAGGGSSAVRVMLRAMKRARTPASIRVQYVGKTLLVGDSPALVYQRSAAGRNEGFFRVWRNGVKQPDVLADAFTNRFIVEAKKGNMGQLWSTYWLNHTLTQVGNYLDIARVLKLRGVRYAVSTLEGVEALERLFNEVHPEAMSSGALSVWWVP